MVLHLSSVAFLFPPPSLTSSSPQTYPCALASLPTKSSLLTLQSTTKYANLISVNFQPLILASIRSKRTSIVPSVMQVTMRMACLPCLSGIGILHQGAQLEANSSLMYEQRD
ncbi:hypothetical protein GOP47_0000462 [Adiantum capillus-veneris]|uniref:Uncharacterized protein n=1 Tax=Adiantum capillus-veneris TaxID=13818 RepID=A0A9D4ZQR4_ADICA|nr:hypothetical protein GOP47_0000462 [Adiantum capillus-veneris]